MKNVALYILLFTFALAAQRARAELKLNEGNIDKIVSEMTLEEKAHLLVGGDNFDVDGRKIDYVPGHGWQDEDIIAHVKDGTLSMEDLDARVKNFLRFIVRTPRFKGYKYSDKPDLKAHAETTRQSATEGMVLLKNERRALPIAPDAKVALFGTTSYNFIAAAPARAMSTSHTWSI